MALLDLTTGQVVEPQPETGAGFFDFLTAQVTGAWDAVETGIEQIGDTVRAPIEALPDVTLDTGDVPELPELNLWPLAAVAGLGLAAIVYTQK